eukprot:SAG11_NODE_1702_length_4421_cov_6.229755_5_plen_85_part_00
MRMLSYRETRQIAHMHTARWIWAHVDRDASDNRQRLDKDKLVNVGIRLEVGREGFTLDMFFACLGRTDSSSNNASIVIVRACAS